MDKLNYCSFWLRYSVRTMAFPVYHCFTYHTNLSLWTSSGNYMCIYVLLFFFVCAFVLVAVDVVLRIIPNKCSVPSLLWYIPYMYMDFFPF